MFSIIIQEKGGEQRRMSFNKPEITIGRVQGNDIVLPKGNVSKRHARIVLKDNKFIIVDLKSTNGTYVNGRKITSPLVVKETDKIYIGDFIVGVDESGAGGGAAEAPLEANPPPQPMSAPEPRRTAGMGSVADPTEAPSRQPLRPPPGPVAQPSPIPAPGPASRPEPIAAPPGPAREPLPPLAPPGEPRTRPPRPAPGGTMPPPVGPAIPAPMMAPAPAPAPIAAMAPPMVAPVVAPVAPMPMPAPVAPMAQPTTADQPPVMAAAPALGAPAPVVPMSAAPSLRARPSVATSPAPVGPRRSRPVAPARRRGVVVDKLDSKATTMLDLQSGILERLRTKLDLDKIPLARLGDEELWQRAERVIEDLVRSLDGSGELPKYINHDVLIKETLNEALGLGPLEDLLADDNFDEILVDRRDRIVVGKGGTLRPSGKAFSSDDVLRRVLARLVAPSGQVIDEEHPVIDVRLRDGSRLTAAIAPVASHGAYLVLTKPRGQAPTLSALVAAGAMSPAMADFLGVASAARRNVLVCGGAGAGKTALLGALAQAAPAGERIVSVEDVAELVLGRDEHVALEVCLGDGGRTSVGAGSLVAAALRMRPDRLVVGEVRADEAYPLVSALAASVDGASAAVAGEGASLALSRLVHLVRLGGGAPSEDVARDLVGAAFDLVIHVVHHAGGFRIQAIDEVLGAGEGVESQPLFTWQGGFAATGAVPRFWAELEAQGFSTEPNPFR